MGDAHSAGERRERRTGASSSRQRLIAAAIELIAEHHRGSAPARDVFAFLNPRTVAEHAGLSRGLIYHHWGRPDVEGSDAFDRFLESVTDEIWNRVTAPGELAQLADLLPDELADVVVALADFELTRFLYEDDGTGRATLALALYGIGSRNDLPTSVGRMAELYDRILVKLGREMVPPLTTYDLSFALMALLDGFMLHRESMGDLIRARYRWGRAEGLDGTTEWSLFAIAIEGIVRNMTRPLPG